MEVKLRELSTKRYRQWQEKERKSWTLVVAGLFLVVYFFPLASIIPGMVSSQLEFAAEALLLLLFLSLVYSYNTTSDNVRRDSVKTDPLANASPFPTGLRASGPPTPPVFHPGSGMLSPASPLGYQNGSGGGGPSRRCYPGTSPQYDSGNFRSSRGEYSWEETRRHQNIDQRTPNNYGVVSLSGGRSGSGSSGGGVIGGGWATVSFTPPSAYQTSPKDKVSGYKQLGDGRAIEFTPALKHLGLDQLSSIFAEKLRKSLGEHVKWKIGEFDKVAREFAPYLIGEINSSASPKLPSFGFVSTLPAPQPAPISSDSLKRDVMDVLLLRTEYVRIDSVQMDVFALFSKANIDANTNQMGRRYKDKLQIFSKIGEGCPFTNRTKNLASVCSELRSAFGSDGYLKLSGNRRGGIGRRVESRSSSTGSDDHLIMSIFFSYCDLYQDSSKHTFTAVYYWPSYNELLNRKGGVPNVGIVKNDIGEFDVFIKKEGKFLLLEIEEENENALSAIVVFLIMFHLEFNGGQFGSDEKGAFDLLLTIMEATSERELNKRLAEEFGWTINN